MSKTVSLRKATTDDIPDIMRLRRMMFEAMGESDPAKLDAMEEACATYLPRALESGNLHVWLFVTESGWPVAGAGLVVDRHLPTPDDLSGRVAHILNVVTHPDYRRQGLARKLMQTMLWWINEQGITKVALEATEESAPLYKMLGFKSGNLMKLDLAHESRQ